MSTEQTLLDRRAIHGDFVEHSTTSQVLLNTLRSNPAWEDKSPVEQEVMQMICHKLARVITGVPCIDTWRDIQGYAKRAEEFLATQPGTVDVQTTKLQLNAAKKWVKV